MQINLPNKRLEDLIWKCFFLDISEEQFSKENVMQLLIVTFHDMAAIIWHKQLFIYGSKVIIGHINAINTGLYSLMVR